MSAVTLRSATAADYDFALGLDREVYRDLVVRQLGAWDETRHRQGFQQQWARQQTSIMLLAHVPVGVLCVEDAAHEVVLHEVQVCPEYQRREIGTEIVRGVMDHAQQRGVPLRLRVFQISRAVELYRRLSFLEEGRTPSHICMIFKAAELS
jgi:GNAT superfamily N-acetyltransferase